MRCRKRFFLAAVSALMTVFATTHLMLKLSWLVLGQQTPYVHEGKTQLPICIGILAYDGKKTLRQTLRSYDDSGLMKLVKVALIHFQKVDTPSREKWRDDTLNDHPVLRGSFSKQNIEFRAFLLMARNCKEPFFVTMEEDFRIMPENYHLVRGQLSTSIEMIENGASAVLLRSREFPGNPNYARESFEKGVLGSQWLIEHTLWNYHAEDEFDEITECRVTPKYWCTSTQYAAFTNNPVLYKTAFYTRLLEESTTLNYSDIEPSITGQWRLRNLTVSRSLGLFTHDRIDRSVD